MLTSNVVSSPQMVLSEEDLRVTLKVLQDNLGEQGDTSLQEVNAPPVDKGQWGS